MTQKIVGNGKKITKLILVAIIFLSLLVMGAVKAQDLPTVDTGSAEAVAVSGMPVEEIISAADAGGLSTNQNLSDLKPATDEQANESPVPAEPSQPEPPMAVFSSDSLKNLESQGGLSTMAQIDSESPTIFKLAAKFLERVVFRNDTEFVKRPTFDDGMDISGTPTFDKDTAGYAIIKEGNQSVVVDFEKNYDSPPIITATLSAQQYDSPDLRAAAEDLLLISDVKYIVTNVSKKGFEIMMDHKADSDIPFAWHALSVNKPKTFKKKGETLKNGVSSSFDTSNNGTNSPVDNANNVLPNQALGTGNIN